MPDLGFRLLVRLNVVPALARLRVVWFRLCLSHVMVGPLIRRRPLAWMRYFGRALEEKCQAYLLT